MLRGKSLRSREEYIEVSEVFEGSVPPLAYAELWDALHGREAWRAEFDDRGILWCFGLEGASQLVISAEPDGGFRIYMHATDTDHVVDDVTAWLSEHEPEPELSDLQRWYIDHIAEQWRAEMDGDE